MAEIKNYQMLIDGKWVDSADGKTFDSINPFTGKIWSKIPEASEDDINKAVDAAERALFDGPWGKMSPTQRGHCLRKLADLLAENSERLGEIETIDTGKMFKETRWQAKYISEFIHFYAGCADKINGDTLPIDKQDMFVFTKREPIGVVAAVVPWNSQLFLSAVKIGPALAGGNTIVLKSSEYASAPMLEFGKLIEQAGIPAGVVNIVTGHGEPCGRALTSHPKVAKVAFTGGGKSAQQVIKNSANNFAQLSLELGGKSPIIVFADADIESAVNGAVGGIFAATGQSCVAGSRLYLHQDIADEFLEKMIAIASDVVIGDPMAEPTQMGPLCTNAQLQHIQTQVEYAKQQGAKILCGGGQPKNGGLFYQPTIIECPSQDLEIVDTELFGPVTTVIRFKDEQEAIKLANNTEYGLAAGIFTRDSARSLRVSNAIRAGIVWVNTYRVISPIAEFGGIKASGYGRESGFQAVLDYTRPKTVWMNTSSQPLANQFYSR